MERKEFFDQLMTALLQAIEREPLAPATSSQPLPGMHITRVAMQPEVDIGLPERCPHCDGFIHMDDEPFTLQVELKGRWAGP